MLKTKEEIIKWLDDYGVKKYTINDDLTVDVNGVVDLKGFHLTNIKVQFNIVVGHFFCSNNKLKTLKGCPKEVGGSFFCSRNKLNNLEFGPVIVGGDYTCKENELINLKGCPEVINGALLINDNRLNTLKYFPKKIGLSASFVGNKLRNISNKDFKNITIENSVFFDKIAFNEELLIEISKVIEIPKSIDWIEINIKSLKSLIFKKELDNKLKANNISNRVKI